MKIVHRFCDIWAGEEGLEEVRVEKGKKREVQKQRKFEKKVKGELTCCCSFFYLYLAYSYDKKLSVPSRLYNNYEKLDHWIMQFITFYWLSHYGI